MGAGVARNGEPAAAAARVVPELVHHAGDVVALNEQTLTLNTWYAGPLPLKRAAIKRVESRATSPAVIYAGPTGSSDWKTLQAGWTYKQGKLYCARGRYSTIGKDVGLPDMASIEFDIAWRGQPY